MIAEKAQEDIAEKHDNRLCMTGRTQLSLNGVELKNVVAFDLKQESYDKLPRLTVTMEITEIETMPAEKTDAKKLAMEAQRSAENAMHSSTY